MPIAPEYPEELVAAREVACGRKRDRVSLPCGDDDRVAGPIDSLPMVRMERHGLAGPGLLVATAGVAASKSGDSWDLGSSRDLDLPAGSVASKGVANLFGRAFVELGVGAGALPRSAPGCSGLAESGQGGDREEEEAGEVDHDGFLG